MRILSKKSFIIFTSVILLVTCLISACTNNNSVGSTNSQSTHQLISSVESSNDSSTNEYIYMVDTVDSRIYMYNVSAGNLTALATPYIQMSKNANPLKITMSPNKQYAYVANTGSDDASNGITIYSIDQESGVLNQIGIAPMPNNGMYPINVVLTSNNHYAYVTSGSCNSVAESSCNFVPQISMYQVESNGLLSLLSPTVVNLPNMANTNIALDNENMHMYVGNAVMGRNTAGSFYPI